MCMYVRVCVYVGVRCLCVCAPLQAILAVLLSGYSLSFADPDAPLPAPDFDAMVVMPKGPNIVRFQPIRTNPDAVAAASTDNDAGDAGDAAKLGGAVASKSAVASKGAAASSDAELAQSAAAAAVAGGESAYAAVGSEEAGKEGGLPQSLPQRLPRYTAAQVAAHGRREDIWITVEAKVYDVTTFLPLHQGGDALLPWAGRDATQAVFGPQHPSTVRRLLQRYLIGELVA